MPPHSTGPTGRGAGEDGLGQLVLQRHLCDVRLDGLALQMGVRLRLTSACGDGACYGRWTFHVVLVALLSNLLEVVISGFNDLCLG